MVITSGYCAGIAAGIVRVLSGCWVAYSGTHQDKYDTAEGPSLCEALLMQSACPVMTAYFNPLIQAHLSISRRTQKRCCEAAAQSVVFVSSQI